MRTQVQQDDLIVVTAEVVTTAEAIVRAEWLRLRLNEHASHGGSDDVSAGEDTRRTSGLKTQCEILSNGCADAMPLGLDGQRTLSAHPPRPVWATQRSPP